MEKSYKDIREDARDYREGNDCTVVAVSVVCGMEYAEAHSLLKAAGRRKGKGLHEKYYHSVIRDQGHTIDRITINGWNRNKIQHRQLISKTVRTVERELAQYYGGQIVMIKVRGHVLVWNGTEIVDWSAGRMHRIQVAYIVYKDTPPTAKRVPVPKRKSLNRKGWTVAAVEAMCPSQGFPEWTTFKSIPEAYRAFGISKKGRQLVRRHVKYHGHATFSSYIDGGYGPEDETARVCIRLINQDERQSLK